MKAIRDLYRARRDAFVDGLRSLGWDIPSPRAGLYVWFPVPIRGLTSMQFATRVMEEAGVIVLPGSGFGALAEGYVRVALTVPEDRIREAVDRIRRLTW
jgi:LL-diaminopimelate aminotransferase